MLALLKLMGSYSRLSLASLCHLLKLSSNFLVDCVLSVRAPNSAIKIFVPFKLQFLGLRQAAYGMYFQGMQHLAFMLFVKISHLTQTESSNSFEKTTIKLKHHFFRKSVKLKWLHSSLTLLIKNHSDIAKMLRLQTVSRGKFFSWEAALRTTLWRQSGCLTSDLVCIYRTSGSTRLHLGKIPITENCHR